jgi:aspartyl-tRNA(Asn)/glutamyl-tRNA(Gln) amidotransferase subunit A
MNAVDRETDLTLLDTMALRASYESGEITPMHVAEAHLLRISQRDPALHAFIHVSTDVAMRQAEASAERWRRGQALGPLDGLMLTLKDNIDVAGMPCTAGTAAFAQRQPEHDALLYQRLRAAGMVLLGKVAMHEAALGATTDNPVYGRCVNPAREGFTPGGSSGGSATAVADYLCHLSVGTDTMGSVRIPAAYCGVLGLIPSRGRLPMHGVIPLSPTLDVAGPLARSGQDLAQGAACLLGIPAPAPLPNKAWQDVRVGIPRQVDEVELTPQVQEAWQRTQRALKALGVVLRPVDIPQWSPASTRLSAFLLSEWEGAEYWLDAVGPGLSGLSPESQKMFRYGAGLTQEKRESVRLLIGALRTQAPLIFSDIDLVLLPTTPSTAFAHGRAVPPNQADFACLANILGTPALSFPCPSEDLPAACQLLAPPGQDERLLSLAPGLDGLWR